MKKFIKIIALLTLAAAAVFAIRGDFSVFLEKVFPFEYKLEISQGAAMYDLDAYFVAAVIKAESSFKEGASSGVAHGLMQITDETAQFVSEKTGLDYEKRLEPKTNILMGCYYLSYLIDKFGDRDTALAAYNAGPATVTRWLGDSRYSADGETLCNIPYAETRKYIRRINIYHDIYKRLYQST